jgi:hypothetical protein
MTEEPRPISKGGTLNDWVEYCSTNKSLPPYRPTSYCSWCGEELETGCSFTHHNYHKFTPLCWECFHTPERRKATAYHWRKPSKFAEVRRRMEERIAANAPKLTRGRIL